jgi:hypothetical protein
MSLSWTTKSDLKYVAGDLIFTSFVDTLSIKSTIVINIPGFTYSNDLHTLNIKFVVNQASMKTDISFNTQIENEYMDNLNLFFTINDILISKNNLMTGLPYNIEDIDINIIEKKSRNTLYTLSSNKILNFTTAAASCLLKGTKINTNNGWLPIEDLIEGDYVLNQHDEPVEIVKKKSWRIKWGSKDFANAVYKIQPGLCGAVETVYISSYHKILIGGHLSEAYTLGLPLATKHEICMGDYYVLYNIQLKNHRKNHFMVNGMCLVESWDGSENGLVLSTSETYIVPKSTLLIQT